MSEEAENEQLTIRIKDGVSALLAGGARLAGHVLCAAGERPTAGSAGTCLGFCVCLIVMVCDRPLFMCISIGVRGSFSGHCTIIKWDLLRLFGLIWYSITGSWYPVQNFWPAWRQFSARARDFYE